VTHPVELHVDGDDVRGEVWLRLEPGTTVAKRERALDDILTDALYEVSVQMGVVLSADPHAYASLTDHLDDQKRTQFLVQAKVEGDRLVPIRLKRRKRK
jgi:hypothetical protein